MLLISNEDGCGVNALFPAVLGDNVKTIPVLRWDHYQRFVRLYVVLNLAFCGCFLILLLQPDAKAQRFYSAAVPMYFAYAFAKVKLGQKRVNISVRKGLNKTVAPPRVWLEYFFFGLAGVLLQCLSMKLDPDPVLHCILILVQAGFAFYAVLPFINYLKFRHQLGKPG